MASRMAPVPASTPRGRPTASRSADTRPTTPLAVLAGAVGLEGLALAGIGVALAVDVLVHVTGTPWRASVLFAALAALFVIYGGALLAAARAVVRRRRGARALCVLSQLIAMLMGWQIAEWGVWQVGLPLAVLGVVAGVLALAPQAGGLLVRARTGD